MSTQTPTVIIKDERDVVDYTTTDMMFAWIFIGVVVFCVVVFCCLFNTNNSSKHNKRVIYHVLDYDLQLPKNGF